MKSYLDLVKEYSRVHKKKNRITVLCIAIAVSLVTAIFGMADMSLRSQMISEIKSKGNWHLMLRNINDETAKLIGDRPDVAASGWIMGTHNGTLNGKILAVEGGNEAISKEMGIKIAKGCFPEKPNEALLDGLAMKEFHISLNDTIPVTLSDGTKKSLTIVGAYDDFSALKASDAHGIYLSEEGIRQTAGSTLSGKYFLKFKNNVKMEKAMDEIKKSYHLSGSQVTENSILLGMIGQSRDNSMMNIYKTAVILFVMVLTAAVLMISSSFNMNVLERIQFFGLLRCLGASKKQVKRFVLLEGLYFSIKGIPIGLLTGTVTVWASTAFLKYVNSSYFSDMPLFGISWISFASGITVGFLTVIMASFSPCRKAAKVSPLSAVTGNINRAAAPQSKTFVKDKHIGLETAMGIHHAFANKKNILLMTGSFAISIILFLSFSVLINFMHQAIKPLKPYTPDVSVISKNSTCSLDADLFEKIKSIPNLKRAYGRMFAYDIPAAGINGSEKINLISYEENQFNWAKKQLTEGSVDAAANETDSVLIVYSEGMKLNAGDMISLKLPKGERKVKVAGILSSSPFDRTSDTETVICSEKTFTKLTGNHGYAIIDIQLAKGANDDTFSKIRSFTTSQMTLSDRRQSNDEARGAYYSFAIFVYGFLVIIASITVLNIISSMNTSVSTRMNQYGMMRAVGMTGRQLKTVVSAEAGTYTLCGCVTGCILGLLMNKILFKLMVTSHWGLAWKVPFAALAVIIGIAVLSAFLSILKPVKKINSMDIVNVVNAQ